MATGDSGPHVQVAAFCDRFIRGAQSGALSLINIIDEVGVAGPDPNNLPPFSLQQLTLVIALWADQTKGRYTIKLRPEAPSGMQLEPIDLAVRFQDTGAKGINLITRLPFMVEEEGVYWFDVLFSPGQEQEDRLLTRIPLTVNYQVGPGPEEP
jgi:hypothetical protein